MLRDGDIVWGRTSFLKKWIIFSSSIPPPHYEYSKDNQGHPCLGSVARSFHCIFYSAEAKGKSVTETLVRDMFSSHPPASPAPTPAEMGPVISLLLRKARRSLLSGALGSLSNTAEIQSSCKVSHRHFGEMAAHLFWHWRIKCRGRKQREYWLCCCDSLLMPSATSHASVELPAVWLILLPSDSPWVPSIGDRPAGSVWACLSGCVFVFISSIFTVGKMARRLTSSPFCPSVSHSIDVTSEQWSCHSWLSLWHQSASLGEKKMYYWINNVRITE